METFDQLIEKINILGFTTYNSKIEFIESMSWYRFPNGHTATFISMKSLNIEFRLVKGGDYVLFICPNSGAKSKSYTFEQAYERIKKDFEDRLLFKAFNSHLFKEVETPKKIQELFDENNKIFELMVCIEKTKKENENDRYRGINGFISKSLYDLHNTCFYEEDSPKLKTYLLFLKDIMNIRIINNKDVPATLENIVEGNMVKYLTLLSAYQLLIDSNIIEEENI